MQKKVLGIAGKRNRMKHLNLGRFLGKKVSRRWKKAHGKKGVVLEEGRVVRRRTWGIEVKKGKKRAAEGKAHLGGER